MVRAARSWASAPQKVLHGALREVLPLGNGLGLLVALENDAVDAALAEFDGQADADRAATDDGDLCFQ